MKNTRKRAITGFLLLFLLVILFGMIVFQANRSANLRKDAKDDLLKMKALVQSLEKINELSMEVGNSLIEYRITKANMAAITLQALTAQSQDEELCFFMDGCTVKVTEDGVEVPEGFPEDIPKDQLFIYDYGESGYDILTVPPYVDNYMICYSHVNGPYYYIEWGTYEEYRQELETYLDVTSLVQGLEKAFQAKIMLVEQPSEYTDDELMIQHVSEGLPSYTYLKDYGITDEFVKAAIIAAGSDDSGSSGPGQILKIGEDVYEVYGFQMDKLNSNLLILFPNKDNLLLSSEQAMIMAVLTFAIGIVFITWILSVLLMVRDHALDDRQKIMFNPANLRKRSWILILSGMVFVIILAALSRSMFATYKRANNVERLLGQIEEKINENVLQIEVGRESTEMKYLQYARYTRDMFTEVPALCTPESMQSICNMTDAAYIMLFDEKGNEIMSNSRLINLSLGGSNDSQTADFRRLLNGVEEIIHDPAVDEMSGLDAAVIGVSYLIDEKKPVYGALIMAIPTEKIVSVGEQDTSDLMKLLAPEESICFSIDKESGQILDASDESLIGQDAELLGLPKTAQHDEFMDYFRLDGKSYYGESSEKDGVLYYFAAERHEMFSDIPAYMIKCALAYLMVMIPLSLFMMFGYSKDYDVYADMGDVLPENENVNLISTPDGRVKRSVDPARRWLRFEPNRHAGMPFKNAITMARILFAIGMILINALVIARLVGTSTDNSVLAYILRGSWSEGVNIFAFAKIFILLCETAMAVILFGAVLQILSSILGTRGETVCRLLLNVLRYVSVVVFAYFALAYLGINTNALLASLGLLSFALSLGAKDLITDILAGISIVFEGEYQVGDIIEVNGYRGMVLEIGVRTTKLEGRGGNIKIIANRDVKNVLNMTRKYSWYPVELNVVCDSEHPIEVIEEKIREQLVRIGERIPEIISGPFYKGVIGFGNGFVTLSIIAECREADYHLVQRELNRELKVVLEECDIQLK